MITSFTVLSQNSIVLNCNFDNGVSRCEYTPSTFTDYSDLLDNTAYWKTCAKPVNQLGGGTNFFGNPTNRTSPDYFKGSCANSEQVFSSGVGVMRFPIGTSQNNGFIALAVNKDWKEGVIFNIEGGLSNDNWIYYELTMKVSYSDTNYWAQVQPGFPNGVPSYDRKIKNHRLKVSFSEWGENWSASSNNNEQWLDVTDAFNLPENSSNEWHLVTHKFRVPANFDASELKNMIIQADIDGSYASAYSDVIFIDEVTLTQINACQSMCLGDNGRSDISIKNLIGSDINSTIISVNDTTILSNFDGTHRFDFKLFFTNTMYYNVKIFDRWGGQQYEYESKDLNILEDDFMNIGGFMPDTTVFRWWGTSQDGTPLMNAGNTQMYTILINARNCNTNDYYGTSVAFQHLTNTFNYTDIRPENFVDSLANCCPEILEVDNHTYTTPVRESRNNYIHSALNDPVTVSSGTFVQYNAGNEIKLGSGFTVVPGGKFEANIRDCELNHYNLWKKTPVSDGTFVNDIREDLNLETLSQGVSSFLIYPNPVKSELSIYTSVNNSTFTVFDIYGRKVDSGILNLGSNRIDVSAYRKGTYTIKINENYVKKIIKY